MFLEGGISPTLLSRYRFETQDLGFPFQFSNHIGLNWDMGWHLRLSYRFQHMSNSGLGVPNLGLNLHMVGLSYRF